MLPPKETMVSGLSADAASPGTPTELVRPVDSAASVSPGPISSAKTEIIGGPPPSFAWLVIKEGPRAGQIFRLNAEGTAIGRDSQCDIILDDDAVSRQHAKVRVEKNSAGEPQFFIYDLATSNGTCVNGEQIIKQGNRI